MAVNAVLSAYKFPRNDFVRVAGGIKHRGKYRTLAAFSAKRPHSREDLRFTDSRILYNPLSFTNKAYAAALKQADAHRKQRLRAAVTKA